MPDFTVSSCGNKFERNKCISSPGKKGQNYFTMSRHSKREISFYKGADTSVRSSLFHSHCSVSGTSSVLSNSKTTDNRTCNYKKFQFNIVLTDEARKELQLWMEKLQLTKGKTFHNTK